MTQGDRAAMNVQEPTEPAESTAVADAPSSGALDGQLPNSARLAGRYDITGELGRGGMGVVYACEDILTGEKVALKLLHTADGEPLPGTASWFWAEARALAGLDHPGIVRARDFGVLSNGAPFLVMEQAPGTSLADLLGYTELTWPSVWLLTDQVLAALGHAHARGVIHGDLKHSNIMVETLPQSLRVRVLDFGLAWLLRDRFDHRIDGSESAGPTVRPHAGTVGWMAPEQICGEIPYVGPPTDLYALGCVLYQLLTGREPYESEDLAQIQRMHRSDPVPKLPLPAGVPHGVAPFVQRLLAKRPWHRYDFAADARREFQAFRPSGPQSAWSMPAWSISTHQAAPVAPGFRDTELRPTFEIPLTDNAPVGLLGFGPGQFIGRAEQKEQLIQHLNELCAAPLGTLRMLVLTGPAGVGKSHLAEWMCEYAHEHAIAIPLRARHNRIPTAVDGIVGAVTSLLGLDNADRATVEQTLLDVWEVSPDDSDALTWVAAVAEWMRPTPPGLRPAPGPTGKQFVINSDPIRWAIERYVLTRLGAKRPLLLWLDDLHLAAPRDFDWIDQLRQQPLPARILLLATTPTGGLDTPASQQPRIVSLVESIRASCMDVQPLAETEMRQILLGAAAFGEDVLQLAVKRSRGIPLFALQLVHAWASGGAMMMVDGRFHLATAVDEQVPETTASLWDERLSALPQFALKAAMAAAALGGEVRDDVLVPLLNSLQLDASRAVSLLEQTQLLAKVGPHHYRWPHGLLYEHLLAKLSNMPDASRVFREAAFALASYHPAAGTRRVLRHRVTNLIRANEHGQAVRMMIEFVARAWERTRDVNATIGDLRLIEGLPRGAWAALYQRWMADALRHAGHLDEAQQLATQARMAFHNLNDLYHEAQCLRLLGHIASEKGCPRDGKVLVSQARAIMGRVQNAWGRAQCDVLLGELDYLLGNHEQARKHLEKAIPPLEQAQDVLGRGQCEVLLSFIELGVNNLQASRQHLLTARQEFDRIGYRLGTAQCDVVLAHTDHRDGEVQAARARGQNALASFRLLGVPRGQAAAVRVMAMAALQAGELSDAQQNALTAIELYEQLGDPWGIAEGQLLVAQVALARSDPEAAALLKAVDIDSVQEPEPRQHWHLTSAWLAAQQGDFELALQHLHQAKHTYHDGRLADQALQLAARVQALRWPEAYKQRLSEACLKPPQPPSEKPPH